MKGHYTILLTCYVSAYGVSGGGYGGTNDTRRTGEANGGRVADVGIGQPVEVSSLNSIVEGGRGKDAILGAIRAAYARRSAAASEAQSPMGSRESFAEARPPREIRRGFMRIPGRTAYEQDSWVSTDGQIEITGARPDNVLTGQDGRLYFIDTIIKDSEFANKSSEELFNAINP